MSITVTTGSDERFAAAIGGLLASLPRTFAPGGESADVVAVDGTLAWVDAAARAIEGGARGVYVLEPSPVPAHRIAMLRDLAARRQVCVRLARRWAGDPAVELLAREPRSQLRTTLVDCRARLPADARPEAALTAQVDFVQSALAGSVQLAGIFFASGSYAATGTLVRGDRDDPLLLSGARSTQFRHAARIRELLFCGRRTLEVGDGFTARAATASVGDDTGERVLTPVYETAFRAAWRALADDLARSDFSSPDLERYRSAVIATDTTRKEVAR